ncbi:MAG: protein-glutamate O-methyltransferase CheR [Planctomycetes bacterium]|nr:protein-glutamate O-methyltransferase CheR [Planctomycetota bacterium]
MRLSDEGFGVLRDEARARCGVVLEPDTRALLEARLEPLTAELGLESLDALARRVAADPACAERAVEALCNHETSFFRDVTPFEVLRAVLAPALHARRPAGQPLVVWSAAASTGQEAYSAAITLTEALAGVGRPVRVIATDLARDVLARAAAGRYGQLEVNRGLPAAHLLRHFVRQGLDWVVRDEVRALVEVRRLNLVEARRYDLPPVDVALLRNVLIYFDLDTRRAVLERLRQVLRPDGALILGAAETPLQVDDAFEWVPAACGGGHYRLRVSPGGEAPGAVARA